LQRDLPPVGADVITTGGRGRVLAQEILAGQVLIETEDMRRVVIDAADVLTVLKHERKRGGEAELADDTQTDEMAGEELPSELAALEDTVVRARFRPTETAASDAETQLSEEQNQDVDADP
jgi:hypothetical protein